MKWLSVSVCGAFGGLARILLTGTTHGAWETLLTILINLSGAFALGYLSSAELAMRFPKWLRVGVCTGFIGAFTTFSGFLGDVLAWAHSSLWTGAGVFCLSVFGGLVTAYTGVALGLWTNKRRKKTVKAAVQQPSRGSVKELIS